MAKTEKELEEDAADYVGAAEARRMARRGYFRDQLARAQTATARKPDPPRYEIRNLGGAKLGEAKTYREAISLSTKIVPSDYALEMFLISDGRERKVATRIRWNADEKRRVWEENL